MNEEKKEQKMLKAILNDRVVRKNLVSVDFLLFFAIYFNHYIKYKMAKFHAEIFKAMQDKLNHLTVVVAFRGSAKSTIITTAYPIWSILGCLQKKFVVIIAQTEQKARQHLLNIKTELENNEVLRKDLGPFEEERTPWGATALVIKKLNAKIMISSAEQSIRGMRHGEKRPDLVILDDVEDTNSVRNQEMRDKLFDWFVSEVIPAGEKETKIVLVGNMLHDDSLVKRIQKKILLSETDGVYLEYPIVDDYGKIAWPGKYPDMEAIEEEKRKTMSELVWSREYLLKMVNKENQVIRREWIKFYDELPKDNPESYYALAIDPAISTKDTADYTAIVPAKIFGYAKNLAIYILPDVINERFTFLEGVNQAKDMAKSLQDAEIYVEDVAFQSSIVATLENMRYHNAKRIKISGDKRARLSVASLLLQNGQVFFPREGAELLIQQLLDFGSERHDDLVDALSLLLNQVQTDRGRRGGFAMSISGDYDGEFDHLDPEERDEMLRHREYIRNLVLL